MRTPLLVSIPVVALLLCNSGLAQTDGPPHAVHLKGLERLVGEWEGEFDPPGEVPKGTVRVTCKWLCHKTYLSLSGTFKPDGVDLELNPVNIFIGYNGKTKTPYAWELSLNGQYQMTAEIKGEGIVMEAKGHSVEGDVLTKTVVYEFRSKDELFTRNVKRTKGGLELPDEDALVLTRVK